MEINQKNETYKNAIKGIRRPNEKKKIVVFKF